MDDKNNRLIFNNMVQSTLSNFAPDKKRFSEFRVPYNNDLEISAGIKFLWNQVEANLIIEEICLALQSGRVRNDQTGCEVTSLVWKYVSYGEERGVSLFCGTLAAESRKQSITLLEPVFIKIKSVGFTLPLDQLVIHSFLDEEQHIYFIYLPGEEPEDFAEKILAADSLF